MYYFISLWASFPIDVTPWEREQALHTHMSALSVVSFICLTSTTFIFLLKNLEPGHPCSTFLQGPFCLLQTCRSLPSYFQPLSPARSYTPLSRIYPSELLWSSTFYSVHQKLLYDRPHPGHKTNSDRLTITPCFPSDHRTRKQNQKSTNL